VAEAPAPPPDLADAGRRWWLAWSETPQATVFTDAEWERLGETARLVDDVHAACSPLERLELVRELVRREEEEFGWVGPAYRQGAA
jgi:hypothetical protein